MKIRDNGSLRTITTGYVFAGGALRTLKTIKVMDGGTLRTVKQFTTSLSASATPTAVSGITFSATPASVNTTSTAASPSGGTAPYSYAWALVSSSGGSTPTASNAALATTLFQQANVADGSVNSAVFRCTITDSFGQTATVDVDAVFSNAGSLS